MAVLQFYARMAHTDGTWIDAAPKVYGFSICNYPSWPSSGNTTITGIRGDYLLYPENNMLNAAYHVYKDSGYSIQYNSLMFCLTNSTADNFFYIILSGNTIYIFSQNMHKIALKPCKCQ